MRLPDNQNTSNNGRPKCLGYVRVSTPDQRDNGLSLDVQQTQIIAKAQELNGELIERFVLIVKIRRTNGLLRTAIKGKFYLVRLF